MTNFKLAKPSAIVSGTAACMTAALALCVLASAAAAAPTPARWDSSFGNAGTAHLPIVAPFKHQSVSHCSPAASSRVNVFGSFGKYTSPAQRSAAAQVRTNGTVVRSRRGKVWRQTPLLEYESASYEMSDGSFVYFKANRRAVSTKLGRLAPNGNADRRFGRSGSLTVPPADKTTLLPLDDGQFLTAHRQDSVTVLRRYSARGKLIRRFGGGSGLRVQGSVTHAASLGESGSVLLATFLGARAPHLAIERADANGSLSSEFERVGLAAVPEFDDNRSMVEGIAVHKADIYLLVSTYPSSTDPYATRNYRIARLNSGGALQGTSAIVDWLLYPGDSGESDEFERRLWNTPRGILYARLEQRMSRSTTARFSLWNTDVTQPPILDRSFGHGRSGVASSRYFVGEKLAPTPDGRFLIVCGSTAFYSKKSGETRNRTALRRLQLFGGN